MPHEELLMWRFYLAEPRGDARSDYHAAQITQAIYTIAQSFSKNSKKVKMEDCLLKFEAEEKNMSKKVSNWKEMAKGIAQGFKKKSVDEVKKGANKSDNKTNIVNKRGG